MTPMQQVAAAIATSLIGAFLSFGAWFVAQTTGTDTLAPYVSGGGAAAAVAGLVYIAKKLASGELVAVPIAHLMESSAKREDTLQKLLDDSKEREDVMRAFLVGRGMH